MAIRQAEATWTGTLREGSGVMKVGSGYFEGPFTYASRFEEAKGANPEELIGAAHAGCFSMFLSAVVDQGRVPARPYSHDRHGTSRGRAYHCRHRAEH